MMKLNPEALEIVSFPTAEPETSALLQQAAEVSNPGVCNVWFSDCASC